MRSINARLLADSPELIVHPMQELHEQLGVLVILIIRDPAGYELCLVSSETFFPSVRAATDYIGPDWGKRQMLMQARATAHSWCGRHAVLCDAAKCSKSPSPFSGLVRCSPIPL